ncbi:MAG: ChbG/HpnK family deacetylase [Kiritimatiellaeota bacterium]|nr:ChbG/HpnK family deacetylase [Kiritimatiellota bacterium]
MKPNNRINADDLGISPGCNAAIAQAIEHGYVNSVSILATGDYLEDAFLKVIGRFPDIDFGVHLNLTYGRSATTAPHLTRHGAFCHGFIGLLLRSAASSRFREAVEAEWDAQIRFLTFRGLKLTHLDSHRHVHMIPWLYRIAQRLAGRYDIPEIRHTRERAVFSIRVGRRGGFILNGGLPKFLVLKLLGAFCPPTTDREMFSILYTGALRAEMLQRLLAESRRVEVVVHPGLPELDQGVRFYGVQEREYRLSADRYREFEACRRPDPK